tara:strand:- start:353 stop:745 length:393 start_codon:yes stop_codon:yes gene_type:complete
MAAGYYYHKYLNLPFEVAISRVTDELQKEGFGVLTEIDIKEKLKEKLNVDFKKYKVLGACNPALAYQALQAEENIGLMLPCNFVVKEGDSGKSEVLAIDPVASMLAVDNPRLKIIAEEVKEKIGKIIDNL